MGKVVRLRESELKNIIENIIKEENFDANKYLEKKWTMEMEDEFRRIMKNVIEKKDPKFPDRIFYVDKNDPTEIYMRYDQKTMVVWIDYEKLWSIFQSKYGLNRQETKEFFKGVLKSDYNLRGITAQNILSLAFA